MLISLCTKFHVKIFVNDIFGAFQSPKIATFHGFPVHYTNQTFLFVVFIRTYLREPNVGIKTFFKLRTIKQPKTCSMRLNDSNHKIDLVT